MLTALLRAYFFYPFQTKWALKLAISLQFQDHSTSSHADHSYSKSFAQIEICIFRQD